MYLWRIKQTNNTVMQVQINDQVYSKRFGNVTVTRIEGNNVYFSTDAGEKMMPAALAKPATKTGEPKKSNAFKNRQAIERENSVPQHLRIHKGLMAIQNGCTSEMHMNFWSELTEEIQNKCKDSAVQSILDKVNFFTITDKQAWLIAYACNGIEITNA